MEFVVYLHLPVASPVVRDLGLNSLSPCYTIVSLISYLKKSKRSALIYLYTGHKMGSALIYPHSFDLFPFLSRALSPLLVFFSLPGEEVSESCSFRNQHACLFYPPTADPGDRRRRIFVPFNGALIFFSSYKLQASKHQI